MNNILRMTPTKIIVHHSLTADSGTVSWGAIRHYHVVEKGWVDIGYHAGAELVGRDYECFMGRAWDEMGAHTIGLNLCSLGFCFVGNFDIEPPPEAQLVAGAKAIALWMRLFGIGVDDVYPHARFAAKTCPGTKFPMGRLREMLTA